MSFLVPAIEDRQRAISFYAKAHVAASSLNPSKSTENQVIRVFTRTRVGVLILCPTQESATSIANEAIRLSSNSNGMEIRQFIGGMSKKIQMRDWNRGRRDIVVATPGRLRDMLHSEPDLVEGLKYTRLVRVYQYSA